MDQLPTDEAWRPSAKIIPAEQFNAWRDARQLLAQANAQIEQSREQARREGHEAGEAEGRQAILRALIDTQARADRYLEEMDKEVAALVIALVERVIGETPHEDRTLAAARQALKRLRKHKRVRVQVPPMKLEHFRAALADLPSPTGQTGWFTVEADQHLHDGECVIATEAGYIQAGIDAQLENLRLTVFESLQSRQFEE